MEYQQLIMTLVQVLIWGGLTDYQFLEFYIKKDRQQMRKKLSNIQKNDKFKMNLSFFISF